MKNSAVLAGCWITEVSLYDTDQWPVPENLDHFRQMLVYGGAGLGRFHWLYCTVFIGKVLRYVCMHTCVPSLPPLFPAE